MTRNQTLLLAGAIFAGIASQHWFSASASPIATVGVSGPTREICVVGKGECKVVPNVVKIRLGVTGTAPTLPEAVAQIDSKAAKILMLRDKFKLTPNDVQTDAVSMTPIYVYDYDANHHENGEHIDRYRAVKSFVFTLHRPAELQAFLSAAVAAGANQAGNDWSSAVTFEAENNDEGDRQSREMAVRAARRKATEMAAALGCRVGEPIMITEDDYSMQAPHLQGATNGTLGPQSNADGGIAVGRVSFECTAKVTFQLL